MYGFIKDGILWYYFQEKTLINKQNEILAELKKRIAGGYYGHKLPKSTELAEEFAVNVKTINKVMMRLVRLQLVERKRRGGTTILGRESASPNPLIEIIYEGSLNIEIHPYWLPLWYGLLNSFAVQNVSFKLNRIFIQADHLIDIEHLKLGNPSARLVLGIHDKTFFEHLIRTRVPFLSVGDPVKDIRIPQIRISFRTAIDKTVETLFQLGCEDIAFIGRIYSSSDSGNLEKYNAWREAMLRHRRITEDFFEHAFLYEGAAYQATLKLLERKVPQLLMVASDTQILEVQKAMREKGVHCPIIGCDGIRLPADWDERRPMPIQAPLFAGGCCAAENICKALEEGRKPKSAQLEAKFVPKEFEGLIWK